MGDVLRVRDYLNMPPHKLMNHPDFDESLFDIAALISNSPMKEIAKGIDAEWLNGIITSA